MVGKQALGVEWRADSLWNGEISPDSRMVILDLNALQEWPEEPLLPPVPVIGFGSPAHPLAASLDALIEEPFTLQSIIDTVLGTPLAATSIMQLLRILPNVDPRSGLILESQCYAMLQGSEEHVTWRTRQPQTHQEFVLNAEVPRLDIQREGEVLQITMIGADEQHDVDASMRDQLAQWFSLAAIDTDIKKVRWEADGRIFSMGAALGEFGTTLNPALAHHIRCHTLPAYALERMGHKLEVKIQGACVGSALEMVAWAQYITANPKAWFHLPELSMGILPGAGGCVSLVKRIGRQRAALMILSGRRVNAQLALEMGLVDALVDNFSVD